MKKHLAILSILALGVFAASCDKTKEAQPVAITIQLTNDGESFATEGVKVSLADAAASYTLEVSTDANGVAAFVVKPGAYTAQATYVISKNGQRLSYNGSNSNIVVAETTTQPFILPLQEVVSQQIVIKELYTTGCPSNDGTKSTTDDAYVILYNNSEIEADASNVVFGFIAPYNAHGSNKYRNAEGALLFENEEWIPSYGAIWWFTADHVTIPAYSQLVVAIFGGIDFTQTYNASVNLANENYYLMSKDGIAAYTNTKYVAGDVIPSSHYLTCSPFTQSNAWAISNMCPAFFIGNMSKDEAKRISEDTENYDTTLGTVPAMRVVKFPKANVIGAVEVWSSANVEKSNVRFSSDINTGYIAIANKLGYTVYRNVDKDATEALPENEGKLVYDYAGALDDANNGAAVIDAEASIAAGAHIIYKQTNDSANDFHIRKVSSLKK